MKKFKTKLTILILAIVSSVSCILFAPQNEVYAKWSDFSMTQSKTITINADEFNNGKMSFEVNLYGSGDETKNYYTLDKENCISDGIITGENTTKNNEIYVSINCAAKSNNDSILKVKSNFEISQEMYDLVNNGEAIISLQARMSPASNQPDTHTMYLGDNGDNEVKSQSFTTDSGVQTITLNKVSSKELYALFTAKCGEVSLLSGKNELKVIAPKLIFTQIDKLAPTITFVDNAGVAYNEGGEAISIGQKAVGRTLTFAVQDDKSGVKSVKFNGKEISPDQLGYYSVNAEYSVDNEITFEDNSGNSGSYVIAKDTTQGIDTLNIEDHKFNKTILTFGVSYLNSETNIHRSSDNLYFALTTSKTASSSDFQLLTKNGQNYEIDMYDIFSELKVGFYYLHVKVIDNAGNESSAYTQEMYYENQEYTIEVITIGGKVNSIKVNGIIQNVSETNDGENYVYNFTAWTNEKLEIEVVENSGYQFYRCVEVIDGNVSDSTEYAVSDGVLKILCNRNIILKFEYRYLLEVALPMTSCEYTLDNNILNTLKDGYVINSEGVNNDNAKDLEINSNKDKIIRFVVTDTEGNAVEMTNVGTYVLSWSILGAYNDSYILPDPSSVEFVITPKTVNVTFNVPTLTYTGEEQTVLSEFGEGNNLTDEEKSSLHLIIKYVDKDNNKLDAMLNAGEYSIETYFDNTNYVTKIVDDISTIVVNKQSISVRVLENNFYYANAKQDLAYSIIDNNGNIVVVETSIEYFIKNAEEVYENVKEVNIAGEYRYVIYLSADASKNYDLSNHEGELIVNKLQVYIVLNSYTYDYTGNEIVLDYSAYLDINHTNVIDSIDGLEVIVNGDASLKLIDRGSYNIQFVTSNLSYELIECTFENITIERKKIKINVTEEYVYIGKERNSIIYKFLSKESEKELDITEITYTLFNDEAMTNEISSFTDVGSYYYKFNIPLKFDVEGAENGYITGSFTVKKAVLEFDFDYTTFEYAPNINSVDSLEYYNLSYNLKSTEDIIDTSDIDYRPCANILITYLKLNDLKNWGDIGEYEYAVTYNNPNIEISNLRGTLTITPKVINAQLDNSEFIYDGNAKDITYSLDCDDVEVHNFSTEIKVVNDLDIIDAGNYYLSIVADNENYIVNITNAKSDEQGNYVTVLPKKISWKLLSDTTYIYSGSEVTLDYALSDETLKDITRIVNLDNSDVKILNAKEYHLKLILDNNGAGKNYIIENNEFTIIITPKKVDILVTGTEKEYAGCKRDIDTVVLDNDMIIRHHMLYANYNSSILDLDAYDFSKNVMPINVGKYVYKVIIDDTNYYASITVGEFEITPKLVNIEFTNNSKTYGSLDPQLQAHFVGLCGKDVINATLQRDEGENVGSYNIRVLSIDNSNYTLDKNTVYKFTIYPKNIIVIADKISAIYGEDYVLTYLILMDNQIVNSLYFNDTLSGKLLRETKTVNDGDVGVYEITKGTLNNPNYNITFVKNYLTITRKNIVILPSDIVVTYGDGEQLLEYSVLDAEGNELQLNNGEITGSLARVNGKNVGVYPITLGSLNSVNYNLILATATYTITPKNITVIANKSSKVYGDLDDLTYTVSGLVGTDTLVGALSRDAGENVGEYNITCGSINTINNPNYIINFVSNTLSIKEAKIKVFVDDKTQVYGGEAVKLTCTVEGLKFDDTLDIKLFRESGDNAGMYAITGVVNNFSGNYVISEFVSGTYTIEKATVVPVLLDATRIYSGKPYTLKCTNFENVKYVCTHNGFEVGEMIDAGEYIVKAIFEGNENYNATESREAVLVIEKQTVIFTISKNEFIYDGKIKYPEYYYDKNIGLKYTSIVFNFEDGIEPIEVNVDGYNYTLTVYDNNYQGGVSGKLYIRNPFSQIYDDSSIIECVDGTYDDDIKDIELVQDTDTKRFNNERVLSVCSIRNAGADKDGYVYTVKVKATEGINSVKVYKVGLNGFKEIAINVEDGYYVFQVDDLNDKYIITTHIKTLSTLAWIIMLVLVATVFTITLIIVIKKKHKKAKAIVSSDKDSNNPNSKDIETYNIN